MRSAADLAGKNIVVYDLEIKNQIESLSRGWDSHDEMGISVLCAFDYRTMRYRVFMDDNLPDFIARAHEPGTLLVAFNQIGFDNKVLRATKIGDALLGFKDDGELRNYDMLAESRRGAGFNVNMRTRGFRLDDHLSTLKLPMKTADGAMAPVWWGQGKVGAVIDYCVSDVAQEKNLFEHIWVNGTVACVAVPTPYAVAIPEIAE